MKGHKTLKKESRISLMITLSSEEQARNISESLKVDDDEYISTSVDGCTIRGEVEAGSVEGARRAADDWLACLMAILRDG
jgi:hypothetical protein